MPDTSPANAFDQAAKTALRNAALPAPPAWMDAQIIAAAHSQAHGKVAPAPRRAQAWWQAPWFKFALPSAAVATVLMSLWLPQTEITQDSVRLPQAARLPAPAPAAARNQAPEQRQAQPIQESGSAPSSTEKAIAVPKEEAEEAHTPPPQTALKKPAPQTQMQARPASSARPVRTAQTASREASPRDTAVAALPALAPAAAPVPAPAEQEVSQAAAPAKNAERARMAAPSSQTNATIAATPAAAAVTQDAAARAGATAHADLQAAAARSTATTLAPLPLNRDAAPVQAQFAAIRKLLADGQQDIARTRLLAMLKQDPDLQIPPDLQTLLPKP